MRCLPHSLILFIALIFALASGCEPESPPPAPPAKTAPAAAASAQTESAPPPPVITTAPPQNAAPQTPTPPAQASSLSPRSRTPDQPGPPSGMIRERAEVGSGAKGHYGQGLIATPAATYWRVRESLAFTIQVPHAIQLFEASEGRPLKSEKEFWDRIIKYNHISLPELPPGQRYFFDLKTKQLMVERPR
jgi:hypothetical protein